MKHKIITQTINQNQDGAIALVGAAVAHQTTLPDAPQSFNTATSGVAQPTGVQYNSLFAHMQNGTELFLHRSGTGVAEVETPPNEAQMFWNTYTSASVLGPSGPEVTVYQTNTYITRTRFMQLTAAGDDFQPVFFLGARKVTTTGAPNFEMPTSTLT